MASTHDAASATSAPPVAPSPLRLIIGDKSYSSWSLRAWLALRRSGLVFDEINIELAGAGSDAMREKIRSATGAGSGKVPALQHDSSRQPLVVWDSLAICEYVAELAPEARLWPTDRDRRAVARSVAAEMHSSFAALRSEMPMNVRKKDAVVKPSDACLKDIARVLEIWRECRTAVAAAAADADGGSVEDKGFLFGDFSIADAMFAPVAMRFVTYRPPLDAVGTAYVATIVSMPELQQWCLEAERESHRIAHYE